MQHEVVLQAHSQAEGVCENPCQFFTYHHPVAVVAFARAPEALIDLQCLYAGFGRAAEHRAIDHVLTVPIVLIGNDLTRQEFPNSFAVRLVVRVVQRAPHRLQPLDDGDVGLAAALAHRLETVTPPGALQFMQQRGHQARPCTADRMAERDCPAIGVDPLWIGVELGEPRQNHRSERFVDFNGVEVVDRHAGALQCMLGGRYWGGQHHRGVTPKRSTAAWEAMRTAAAPSEIWLATAAVRMPPWVKVGRPAIFSSDVSARGPSSTTSPA